jgi:hypothetical protein
MDFELLSAISDVQIIAAGRQIRELKRLQRVYGRGRWRKLKGRALVRFKGAGVARLEEVHRYEAHGIGKREIKIKFRPP